MEDYPQDHDPAEAADGNLDLDENLLDRAISVTLAEMSKAETENESASLQDASIAAKILKEKLSKSQPSDLPGGFSQDGGEFFSCSVGATDASRNNRRILFPVPGSGHG